MEADELEMTSDLLRIPAAAFCDPNQAQRTVGAKPLRIRHVLSSWLALCLARVATRLVGCFSVSATIEKAEQHWQAELVR
jgi:hypothetical protein